ncbi:MAG: hypothetical protein GY940_32220 [bacterium]|nr:hypothetical protein [bacterium]
MSMRRYYGYNKFKSGVLPAVFVFSLFFFILAGAAFVPLAGQETGDPEDSQERIVEKVDVTNVQVPVRVIHKGKPVTHLTIGDFTLYEGKKKVKINGFYLKRKKIGATDAERILQVKEQKGVGDRPLPRAFVLVFSITDFNDNLKRAVNYLFENVLKPNDWLMVFANDETLTHPDLRDGKTIRVQLLDHLREESHRARRRLITYINKVETYLDVHDFRLRLSEQRVQQQQPVILINFLKKYLLTWNEYKSKYLTPRIDRFYYFSRYLENMKAEKWVLNFYQLDLFPKIRLGSETMDRLRELASQLIQNPTPSLYSMGKVINGLLNRLAVDLIVNKGVPTREISKLFHKVDATFHSFFIRSLKHTELTDFEYNEVASGIEATLKEITKVTGGRNITSNNLVKSLETVSNIEDSYYMLSYVPRDPKKTGKVKVKLKNRKYKVHYDDNIRADYIAGYLDRLEKTLQIPEIKITEFSFKQKILVFTVGDFLMKTVKQENDKSGRLQVRIQVMDKNNKPLFDQNKLVVARKGEITISLGTFKRIKEGEYNFIISAADLLTRKIADWHQNIVVKK